MSHKAQPRWNSPTSERLAEETPLARGGKSGATSVKELSEVTGEEIFACPAKRR